MDPRSTANYVGVGGDNQNQECAVLNARHHAVFIAPPDTILFEDKTVEIRSIESGLTPNKTTICFTGKEKYYTYCNERIFESWVGHQLAVPLGQRAQVGNHLILDPLEMYELPGPDGPWYRIFYADPQTGEECYASAPISKVVFVAPVAAVNSTTAAVIAYWDRIVAAEPQGDPLPRSYSSGPFHPNSGLATYLEQRPIQARTWSRPLIFPFSSNLSQRQAVKNALTSSVSVIQGPPGTGKTETILNIIANVVSAGAGSVGVVSSNNTAVDNIGDKLKGRGFGQLFARLGNYRNQTKFFEELAGGQRAPTEPRLGGWSPPLDRLEELESELSACQELERKAVDLRTTIDAYRLEQRHFVHHLAASEIPDLAAVPLFKRSSDRILDYLVDIEVDRVRGGPNLFRRVQRFLRYGATRRLDPDDAAVVSRVQEAFFRRRYTELGNMLEPIERKLQEADIVGLTAEYAELSERVFRLAQEARVRLGASPYTIHNFRDRFDFFIHDYPVILSSCHSLRKSLAVGYLLDVLVIDEASQVDPIVAGLAMGCARNLVIVGDDKQLPPVHNKTTNQEVPEPPSPAYDQSTQSILSSVQEIWGDQLPTVLLREHYRCDPTIIGFCNKMYYDGDLVAYTQRSEHGEPPMKVWRTTEGNHSRTVQGAKGLMNQREAEMVVEEAMRQTCANIPEHEVGAITPYRLQVDKIRDVIEAKGSGAAASTVHGIQGQQREAVILSTVLGQAARSRRQRNVVNDPQLINVAVSRAVRRFVLVMHHSGLPESRHIRDLADYIAYQDPQQPYEQSKIVSIFDLLYSEYSNRLAGLAGRYDRSITPPAEPIAWEFLQMILSEAPYQHLKISQQVHLRNLFDDRSNMTDRERRFVGHASTSVDFMVTNRVTNRPVLPIEVDGYAFHGNKPDQLERDRLKDKIFKDNGLEVLRLSTIASNEEQRVRDALNRADSIGMAS